MIRSPSSPSSSSSLASSCTQAPPTPSTSYQPSTWVRSKAYPITHPLFVFVFIFVFVFVLVVESAMIGVREFMIVWNFFMLLFNTCGYQWIAEVTILFGLIPRLSPNPPHDKRRWSEIILVFRLIFLLFTMLANFVLKDHLMVHSIFNLILTFITHQNIGMVYLCSQIVI